MEFKKTGIQHLPFKVHSRNFLRRRLLKEHETRKLGIQDLTLQSSFLELFEEETLKGTWDKKSPPPQESKIYHPRFILTSAVPGQVRKTGFTGLLDVGYVVYHRHKQEISGE